jgi:hypothetical protein
MENFLIWKNRQHIKFNHHILIHYQTSKKQHHAGRGEWNGDDKPAAKKSKQVNRLWIFF